MLRVHQHILLREEHETSAADHFFLGLLDDISNHERLYRCQISGKVSLANEMKLWKMIKKCFCPDY